MSEQNHDDCSLSKSECEETTKRSNDNKWLLYSLNDIPPWYLSMLLALQHYLLSISGLMGVPLLLASYICLNNNEVGNTARALLISSVFFVSGLSTLLQTTLGNRLPILQGTSFAYLAASFATLSLPQNQCPDPLPAGLFNSTQTLYNDTDGQIVDEEQLWMRRVVQIQGAIAVAAVTEVLLGLTGSISFILRLVGPLTITPTIALMGLDLYVAAPKHSSAHWGASVFTMAVLIVTSQYCKNCRVPIPAFNREKKCHVTRYQLLGMFPVLIALVVGWILCWILTVTNVLPADPNHPQHVARTDFRMNVMRNSPWFRIPYPFQWGVPRVSFASVIGMMAGVLASTVESIGDYYACAKLSGAPPPPKHAINRGIFVEGIGCILAGIFGTTSATTSFSSNIAALGITRVGSRRVLQIAGLILVVLGCIGKLGAIFVLVPEPVIGGLFTVLFGMIAAVGLSNLQYVDLNSSRNIFIIGFSLFLGLSVPGWLKANRGAINTGISELDNIFNVVLQSSMLVGGLTGMFFDNTLPGTEEERGFKKWLNFHSSGFGDLSAAREYEKKCYDLPFSTDFRFAKYIPILPQFDDSRTIAEESEIEAAFVQGEESTL